MLTAGALGQPRTQHARERLERLGDLCGDVRRHQGIENQGRFQVGKKSEVLVRFSTVACEHGVADAEGDIVCQPWKPMKLSLVKNQR